MNCPHCHSKTMVIRTLQLPAKTIRTRLCPRCSLSFSTVETIDPSTPVPPHSSTPAPQD